MGDPYRPVIWAKSSDLIEKIGFVPAIAASSSESVLESHGRKRNTAMVTNRRLIRDSFVETGPTEDIRKTFLEGIAAITADFWKNMTEQNIDSGGLIHFHEVPI
jgi:hypothetical protein